MILNNILFNPLTPHLIENFEKGTPKYSTLNWKDTSSSDIVKSKNRAKKLYYFRFSPSSDIKNKQAIYRFSYISHNSTLPNLGNKLKSSKLLVARKPVIEFNNSLIISRLDSSLPVNSVSTQKNLKEKYSFFSHFSHRKNILRKLMKITTYNFDGKPKYANFNLFNYYKSVNYNLLQKDFIKAADDFNIQRIRFKPGYQVIWRKARSNLQELLGFKLLYQKKLTRLLTRFYRLSHLDTHKISLITMERIILLSKLLPDPSTINNFTKSKCVYLNGAVLNTQNSLAFSGDFIQVKTSSWLVMYSNFLNSWYKDKTTNLKIFAKKRVANKALETNKLFRTRTSVISSKFLKFINVETVIPNFLEVDFFTMSTIILYKSNIDNSIDTKNQLLSRINIFKNYNWKYLN